MGNFKSSAEIQTDNVKSSTDLTQKTRSTTDNQTSEPSGSLTSFCIPKIRPLGNLNTEGEFDAPTAKILTKPKTAEDIKLIRNALLQHFLFNHLPTENVEHLISEMLFYSLGPNQIIFRQGDPGNVFFVLAEGRVEIIINSASKGFINAGNSFGELALIHDSRRTATIRTVEEVRMWGIGRKVFRDALKTLSSLKFDENKEFLRSVPFLQMLTEAQRDSLVTVAVSQEFSHGQKIVVEGDPGDLFYIIQEGSVQCSSGGVMKRVLNKGEYFGEQALLYNTPRTATVTAIKKVKVLSMGRDMLVTVLGDKLQFTLYKNTLRIAFDKSKGLKGMNKAQIEQAIEKIQIFSYQNQEVVVPQGAVKNRYVWIVLKGAIRSSKGTVNVYENIGADWVYREDSGLVDENYYALGEVDVGVIRSDLLEKIIDGKLVDLKKQNDIIEILKCGQLLRMLDEGKLRLLSKCVKIKEFKENEKIFMKGDEGDCFYIVKTGEVCIINDGNVDGIAGKGSFFGKRTVLLNEKRNFTVTSKSRSELYVLSRSDFLDVVDEHTLALLIKRIKTAGRFSRVVSLAAFRNAGERHLW